jgi:hypothetical protein
MGRPHNLGGGAAPGPSAPTDWAVILDPDDVTIMRTTLEGQVANGNSIDRLYLKDGVGSDLIYLTEGGSQRGIRRDALSAINNQNGVEFLSGSQGEMVSANTSVGLTLAGSGAQTVIGFIDIHSLDAATATPQGLALCRMGGDYNSFRSEWKSYFLDDGRYVVSASNAAGASFQFYNVGPSFTTPVKMVYAHRCALSNNAPKIWLNSLTPETLDAGSSWTSTPPTTSYTDSKWTIAGQQDPNGALNLDGYFGECRIFNRLLTDNEVHLSMQELATKYGVTLS